ncbi:MAG: hypothetical protein GY842_19770 [bacterium]|nr:hypothetical protein [bacterium]
MIRQVAVMPVVRYPVATERWGREVIFIERQDASNEFADPALLALDRLGELQSQPEVELAQQPGQLTPGSGVGLHRLQQVHGGLDLLFGIGWRSRYSAALFGEVLLSLPPVFLQVSERGGNVFNQIVGDGRQTMLSTGNLLVEGFQCHFEPTNRLLVGFDSWRRGRLLNAVPQKQLDLWAAAVHGDDLAQRGQRERQRRLGIDRVVVAPLAIGIHVSAADENRPLAMRATVHWIAASVRQVDGPTAERVASQVASTRDTTLAAGSSSSFLLDALPFIRVVLCVKRQRSGDNQAGIVQNRFGPTVIAAIIVAKCPDTVAAQPAMASL